MNNFWLLKLFAYFFSTAVAENLRACRLDDYHYEYTDCDSDGGRWRVAVPKQPGLCTPSNPPGIPKRGKECNFACEAGEYLDVQGDQECHPCKPGTYSLGGGVRFDEWSHLPEGFTSDVENMHSNWFGSHEPNINCSRSEWTPRGKFVMSVPSGCPSSLVYSARLVKAGKVTFKYQFTDPETLFHFTVQNDQCQAASSKENSLWPEVTKEGNWRTAVLNLKSGMNVLQWRSLGAMSLSKTEKPAPIMISEIHITGIAYTSRCYKCRNGTYSSGGSSFCQVCPANKYSTSGASQCSDCPPSQYSEIGVSACKMRPPCTKNDYYKVQEPCDDLGQSKPSYRWIQPKICNQHLSASVDLPADGFLQTCPPCNPGMHSVNKSHCDFCEPGQWADPSGFCVNCPVSTSPRYEINYKHWVVMPPNVTSHCAPFSFDGCSDSSGWIPAFDHVRTSYGPRDEHVYLLMTLHVAGFQGHPGEVDGKATILGNLVFEFELICEDDCQLMLLSDAGGPHNAVLQSWTGTIKRQTFSTNIFTNESVHFTWAFQPVDYGEEDDSKTNGATIGMNNEARIYQIKVTNTIAGAVVSCDKCPKGKVGEGCIPCPDGQYVDKLTTQCVPCPKDTVLPRGNSFGKEHCKPCGPGLKPYKGRSCKSDCHFTDDSGRTYDFTQLDGLRFVSGAQLFTASGTQYHHGFNLTLCNHDNGPLPSCVNNVTEDATDVDPQRMLGFLGEGSQLSSMVCRSTLVPQGNPAKPVISTQPVSLGSHLTKIVTNISLEEMYKTEGFSTEGIKRDIHFYYESSSTTSACPNGRSLIISLRCDPLQKGKGEIQLPPKCSDGTCDGCSFHFLWTTRHACPRCEDSDYQVVRGECVDGEQSIHYIPHKGCLEIKEKEKVYQKCSVLPFAVVVAIPVSLGLAFLLILVLIYCWSRNKKLEYKYMKLVETAGGQDGELPAADTCGMEDDEEDIHFADSRSGTGFFSKLKGKFVSQKDDDDNPFVAVKMSEHMSLT